MKYPQVSVIIPCRNEKELIGRCIDSVVNSDYPSGSLEILPVDGMSEDGTRERVLRYAEKYHNIKLLDNPKKHTPAALNIGIKNCSGDFIIIMSAHASFPAEYILKCVKSLSVGGVDCVGGILATLPCGSGPLPAAIALALSHPFGVGNSYFRTGAGSAMAVDTVPYGCYRRDVFDRIGLFDERLIRNQDIEFNKRLIKSGGKILLVPDIISYYYARGTFGGLWRNNFDNGKWVILTSYFTGGVSSLSLRHFVPLMFLFYLLLLPIAACFSLYAVLPLAIYLALSVYFSIRLALKNDDIGLAACIILSFFILHVSYGTGSIAGIFSSVAKKIKKRNNDKRD